VNEPEEQARCFSSRPAYRLASFFDMPASQAISPCTRSVSTGTYLLLAWLPDRAWYDSGVTVGPQRRVPVRCIPQRLQAADVLHLAGVVCFASLADVIWQCLPVGLEAANTGLQAVNEAFK
jgi:hypothetical protein